MISYLIDPLPLLHFANGTEIDPDQLFRQVEHDGEIEDIYEKLSLPGHTVDEFECLRHPSYPDCLYVDLFGPTRHPQFWFSFYRYPQPLAGRGLLCGLDETGDNCDPIAAMDETRLLVSVGYKNCEWTQSDGLRRLDTHVLEHWKSNGWLRIDSIVYSNP